MASFSEIHTKPINKIQANCRIIYCERTGYIISDADRYVIVLFETFFRYSNVGGNFKHTYKGFSSIMLPTQ
jgi:hypothetical protein